MIEKISDNIVNFIKNNIEDVNQEKEEVLNYGLQIFIYEIFMFIFVLVLSVILKIFNYVLIAVITYSIIRGLANGAHARTRVQCAVSYLTVIFSVVYICKYIFKIYSIYFASIILLADILVLYMYAPGDTEENPNYIERRRIIQKYLSIAALTGLFTLAYITNVTHSDISNMVMLVSTFGVSLTTPLAYKMLSCKRSTKV